MFFVQNKTYWLGCLIKLGQPC